MYNPCVVETGGGLRYPLQNETLAPGLREGASNECVDGPFQITVGSGVLLVFIND